MHKKNVFLTLNHLCGCLQISFRKEHVSEVNFLHEEYPNKIVCISKKWLISRKSKLEASANAFLKKTRLRMATETLEYLVIENMQEMGMLSSCAPRLQIKPREAQGAWMNEWLVSTLNQYCCLTVLIKKPMGSRKLDF